MKLKSLGNPVVLQSSRAEIAKFRCFVCFSWQQLCVCFFPHCISLSITLTSTALGLKAQEFFAQSAPRLEGVSNQSETIKTNIVQMNLDLPVIGETIVAS